MRETKFYFYHRHREDLSWVREEVIELSVPQNRVKTRTGEYSLADGHLVQYTGLKDKNGKEIYEGDIIRNKNFIRRGMFGDSYYDGEYKGEIIFKEGEFDFKGRDSFIGNLYSYNSPHLEVIGNIYENPELLSN
jgi:uncharacterized phage protein (TIGR01671 family)